MRTTRILTAALALACLLAAVFYLRPTSASAAAECEGDACPQVTLTYDEAGQQYRARNNSPDRWARAAASNVASAADACVAPGKAAHLPLKSIVGPYRADFAEPRCGAPE